MSNVSEAAVIREMDLHDLEQEHERLWGELKKCKNLDESSKIFRLRYLIQQQINQLTHKNINND